MIKYPKYEKVLFCTDFSENSDCAFEYAFGIAKRDDAILYVLHVIPRIPDQYYSDLYSHMEIGAEDVNRDHFDKIKASLQESLVKSFQKQYLSKIKDKDKVKFVVKSGREDEEILKYAREENIDLVVIGTHGRTGLKHVLLGSVAEKTIRHSSIPVYVVPCKEKSGSA